MNILTVENITKAYGVRKIFDNALRGVGVKIADVTKRHFAGNRGDFLVADIRFHVGGVHDFRNGRKRL